VKKDRGHTSKRIVVVDDSDVVLQWVREALEPLAYEVLTYSESLGIHRFIKKEQPALVLLDVKMPALNGNHICRLLKNDPQTRDVCVALFSAVPEDRLAALTREAGADGYIAKTKNATLFAKQVRQLIGDVIKTG